eukprot:gene10561-12214_t
MDDLVNLALEVQRDAQQPHEEAPKADQQGVSDLLHALASVRHRPGPKVLSQLLGEGGLLDQCNTSEELSQALYQLSRLGVNPGDEWIDKALGNIQMKQAQRDREELVDRQRRLGEQLRQREWQQKLQEAQRARQMQPIKRRNKGVAAEATRGSESQADAGVSVFFVRATWCDPQVGKFGLKQAAASRSAAEEVAEDATRGSESQADADQQQREWQEELQEAQRARQMQAPPAAIVPSTKRNMPGLLDFATEEEAQRISATIHTLERCGRMQQASQLRKQYVQELQSRRQAYSNRKRQQALQHKQKAEAEEKAAAEAEEKAAAEAVAEQMVMVKEGMIEPRFDGESPAGAEENAAAEAEERVAAERAEAEEKVMVKEGMIEPRFDGDSPVRV